MLARQLALPFPQDVHYPPETYLRSAANAEALAWIDKPECWPACRLAVQGEAGSGKTHLLHVFAYRYQSALLSAEALRVFMPLPNAKSLAIDNADALNNPRALLHILNAATERRMPTLLAGRSGPAYWGISLPDLNSRLRASAVVTLRLPDDAMLSALLRSLLKERQLQVSERLQAYMLLHLPRTGGALREAVARLDRLALAGGCRVTRAMAVLAVDAQQPSPIDAQGVDGDDLLSTGVFA